MISLNHMEKSSTIFLQIVIVALSLGALAFLLWEPTAEGVNVNKTLFQIYFNDPFIAYAYIGSIAFFTAVYQTFKLLGYIGRNEEFSEQAVKTLRTIKYCAMVIIGFILPCVAYLFIVRPGDDIAGGVAMGLFIIFVSAVVAANVAIHERIWRKGIDMKTENDLTV